jgi:hypothetical protein
MAEIDRIRICSEALVLIGEQPIDTFEGASVPQLVAQHRYAAAVNMLLAEHPWDFNRRVTVLAADADADITATAEALGYSRGYALPGQCWYPEVPLINQHPATDWEFAEGHLYLCTNLSDVVALVHRGAVDELRWSPKFREAVVYLLASEFAVPIAEDMQKAEAMRTLHMTYLRQAKHQNAIASPQPPIRARRLAARKRQ